MYTSIPPSPLSPALFAASRIRRQVSPSFTWYGHPGHRKYVRAPRVAPESNRKSYLLHSLLWFTVPLAFCARLHGYLLIVWCSSLTADTSKSSHILWHFWVVGYIWGFFFWPLFLLSLFQCVAGGVAGLTPRLYSAAQHTCSGVAPGSCCHSPTTPALLFSLHRYSVLLCVFATFHSVRLLPQLFSSFLMRLFLVTFFFFFCLTIKHLQLLYVSVFATVVQTKFNQSVSGCRDSLLMKGSGCAGVVLTARGRTLQVWKQERIWVHVIQCLAKCQGLTHTWVRCGFSICGRGTLTSAE